MVIKEAPRQKRFQESEYEVSRQIAAQVHKNLPRYFPELTASFENLAVQAHPIHRGHFTLISEIILQDAAGGPPRQLIAKTYRRVHEQRRNDQDVELKSRREHEFHQQVYDYFARQDPEYTVVKPLDYFPKELTLVIEKAEGQDLGRLIQGARYAVGNYPARKQELGRYFWQAGKWLSLLHQGFAAEVEAAFEAARFEQQINYYFERLQRAGGNQKSAEEIRQRLIALRSKFPTTPIPAAKLHGDYKFRHIFIAGQRFTSIDFGNELIGETFDDVARFLVETKLLDHGAALPIRRELTTFLQNQFLQGYFGTTAWPPALRFFYAVWLMAKWGRRLKKFVATKRGRALDAFMQASGVKSFVNHAYVDNWFRQVLLHEITALEKEG